MRRFEALFLLTLVSLSTVFAQNETVEAGKEGKGKKVLQKLRHNIFSPAFEKNDKLPKHRYDSANQQVPKSIKLSSI